MKDYVDQVCEDCAANGVAIAMDRISVPRGYRDGAVVAPLDYEDDEFCGLWFVQFGLAVNQRFMICRLDLGQARFRFSGANDVQYPEAIRENEAKVKRDNLIEAFDQRFGPDHVNTAASTAIEAKQIWERLWPCEPSPRRPPRA
jgi:hypothetical protein